MRHLRTTLMFGFALLSGLAFFVSRGDALPDTLKQVVPGVWFREGGLTGKGHCNNIIIEMKDYLIVVDANFPSGARAAMADAKRVSAKPVKYVFDTHHHGDHAYGNAVWTQNGATTLAFKGVKEEMQRYEPKRWLETAKSRKDVGELNKDTAEPPKQDINEDRYTLNDGKRKVEFYHFGWAHTRGDGFVYLPKEQVVCTGDAIVNGPYNYTADANVGNWPNVVRSVAKLKIKYVLPGHGESGGREVLTGQEEFFTELHKAVRTAVDQGKPLEGLEATIKLPDSVKHWVGNSFKSQVADTYNEIKQAKPAGDLPH